MYSYSQSTCVGYAVSVGFVMMKDTIQNYISADTQDLRRNHELQLLVVDGSTGRDVKE